MKERKKATKKKKETRSSFSGTEFRGGRIGQEGVRERKPVRSTNSRLLFLLLHFGADSTIKATGGVKENRPEQKEAAGNCVFYMLASVSSDGKQRRR